MPIVKNHACIDSVLATTWPRLDQPDQGTEVNWLLSEIDLFPPEVRYRQKADVPVWSPATFCGRRSLANVITIGAMVLDIDHWPGAIDEFSAEMKAIDQQLAWHTTYSATATALRFRFILPLSRRVDRSEYDVLWRTVVDVLGFGVDTSTKDASRAWYIPTLPPSEFYWADSCDGQPIDVDGVLRRGSRAQVPRPVPPPAIWLSDSDRSSALGRVRAYVEKIPGAVSGQRGHTQTFRVAQYLVRGFGLSDSEALQVLEEWNQRCVPPWEQRDLMRKITEARHAGRLEPNYLIRRVGGWR